MPGSRAGAMPGRCAGATAGSALRPSARAARRRSGAWTRRSSRTPTAAHSRARSGATWRGVPAGRIPPRRRVRACSLLLPRPADASVFCGHVPTLILPLALKRGLCRAGARAARRGHRVRGRQLERAGGRRVVRTRQCGALGHARAARGRAGRCAKQPHRAGHGAAGTPPCRPLPRRPQCAGTLGRRLGGGCAGAGGGRRRTSR